MTEEILTEEIIYEAANITNGSLPLDEIKYVGFTLQQFGNLALLATCKNLQIVNFKLCSLTKFPGEIFSLKKLQNLDLSGNQISELPEVPDEWSQLNCLRYLNLSDNIIAEITEILHIKPIPCLKQLVLTGNPCLSSNDSFNTIVSEFSSLYILNDSIITSQHRGYINGCAQSGDNSLLPLSKTDDFFFLYVKYMRVNDNERYIRKANAEFFCLNKVIRKYSAADKIQSVFRGYLARSKYKRMISSIIKLQNTVRRWYAKRVDASGKIKSFFAHSKEQKQVEYQRAVRLIQSIWRRRMAKRKTILDVIGSTDKHEFYLTEDGLSIMIDILNKYNLRHPDYKRYDDYKIIRIGEPKICSLPGSPLVYHRINSSLIVRRNRKARDISKKTLWCAHDHESSNVVCRVNQNGVNWTKKCLFCTLKPKPYLKKVRTVKLPKYNNLVLVGWNSYEDFSIAIKRIFEENPANLQIFPTRVVMLVSSQIVLQSSLRSAIQKIKDFSSMRTKILENRAKMYISSWLKTMKIMKNVSFIARIGRYIKSLPEISFFYTSRDLLNKVDFLPIKNKVNFGFNAERLVTLDKKVSGCLTYVIPKGDIMFALNQPQMLLKFGTTTSTAISTGFSRAFNPRWIKRFHIKKVSFINPRDAINRLALFYWITCRNDIVMTESDIVKYCSAHIIKSVFIGGSTRRMLMHLGVQTNALTKLKMSKKYKRRITEKEEEFIDVRTIKRMPTIDPNEAIRKLRGVLRPWTKDFKNFKVNSPQLKPLPLLDEKVAYVSKSVRSLGLYDPVTDDDSSYLQSHSLKDSNSSHESRQQVSDDDKSKYSANSMSKPSVRSSQMSEVNLVRTSLSSNRSNRVANNIRVYEFDERKGFFNNSGLGSTLDEVKTLLPPKTGKKVLYRQPNNFLDAFLKPESVEKFKKQNSEIDPIDKSIRQSESIKSFKQEMQARISLGMKKPASQQKIDLDSTPLSKVKNYLYIRKSTNEILKKLRSNEYKTRVGINIKKRANSLPNFKFSLLGLFDGDNECVTTTNTADTKIETHNKTAENKEERKNETENIEPMNKPSRQVVDHAKSNVPKQIFQRLFRLYQIGEEISRELSTEDKLEKNREKVNLSKRKLVDSRISIAEARNLSVNEVILRNKIEKESVSEYMRKSKSRMTNQRTLNARYVKNVKAKKMQNIKDTKAFNQAFVTASRSIAQHIERVARREKDAKMFMLARENFLQGKRAQTELRKLNKQKRKQLEELKLQTAIYEKKLDESRREERFCIIDQCKQRLYEEKIIAKQKHREILQLRNIPKKIHHIEPAETGIKDNTEETAAFLLTVSDSNYGFIEAHYISEMIRSFTE